jgi:hypothetical protein
MKFILAIIMMVIFTGCGISIGDGAWATTGFMEQHNAKLKILQANRLREDINR